MDQVSKVLGKSNPIVHFETARGILTSTLKKILKLVDFLFSSFRLICLSIECGEQAVNLC